MSNTSLLNLDVARTDKEPHCVVVRLETSAWHDDRGLNIKKTLRYLKRQCEGFNFLEEDCYQAGADEIIPQIVNLNTCPDGVYYVIVCNQFTDWETGIVEDYDYKLVPFEHS